MIYKGKCHCGKIAFDVEGELTSVIECNCSICYESGYLHWMIDPSQLRMKTSLNDASLYQWGTGQARHYFCPKCGVAVLRSLFNIVSQMRKPEAERDPAKIAEGEREARDHFAYLERELKGCQFFASTFSLGDISFIPPLANLERAGFSIPDDFPNLKAWWTRMK